MKTFLFIAVVMFTAKPFIGFSVCSHLQTIRNENIIVKAFTRRKQEYVQNGEFDVVAVQLRLKTPPQLVSVLYIDILNILYPVIFAVGKFCSKNFLAALDWISLRSKQHFLLGKLTI